MRKFIAILCLLLTISSCKQKQTLPDPYEAGWNGEKVCEILEDNKELRVLKCSFPAGVGHEKHYHDPHFGYTLVGGTFKIIDHESTREVTIPDGYSWKKDSITVHEVKNIGNNTAAFLIIEYK